MVVTLSEAKHLVFQTRDSSAATRNGAAAKQQQIAIH
jgi:hypothetical protein